MIRKLSEKEVELYGSFRHPVITFKSLFKSYLPDKSALADMKEKDEEGLNVRLYQLPYLSYEYMLVDDGALSHKENFKNKIGAGSIYAYTGRGTGKSLLLLLDLLLDTIFNYKNWNTLFSAFDKIHVEAILEHYIDVMKRHSFFRLFRTSKLRRQPYKIYTYLGHRLDGISMNLTSSAPGANFESHHSQKHVIDEHQYETEEVLRKRSQAKSDYGAIERFSGITNFTRKSPAGRIFFDPENKNKIVNLPAYVKPDWNFEEKKKAIKDYNETSSPGYKIHILAEVVEGSNSLYDLQRIRNNYTKRKIQRFDIDKDNYEFFKENLVLEKWKNSFRTWIGSDWGGDGNFSAPTEITILFEIKNEPENIYALAYNITLYKLKQEEQCEVFKYIVDVLNPNFVAIDGTNIGGKWITKELRKVYPNSKEKFIDVDLNGKIKVDYQLDAEGKVVIGRDGNPIYQEEWTIDWAIRRLKTLLYNNRIDIPANFYKLEKEFAGMRCVKSGNRLKYMSITSDHTHQALEIFAIAEWQNRFNFNENIKFRDWSLGV